uniref:Transmembrane protein n=2 Tax=Panagrolaimus sp. JU765 TaxID=591449 RepID=A0AC34RNW9_9BILA
MSSFCSSFDSLNSSLEKSSNSSNKSEKKRKMACCKTGNGKCCQIAFGVILGVAVIGGAYYLYKNRTKRDVPPPTQ